MWSKFGTDFAYIHTGIVEYAVGGTTFTISKMGSGVKDIVDPCLEKFMKTKQYYNSCKKWGLLSSCHENDSFPTGTA